MGLNPNVYEPVALLADISPTRQIWQGSAIDTETIAP